MGLDLSPSFWKSLVGLPLDPVTDIKEADPITYSYMKKIEVVNIKELFFVYLFILVDGGLKM